MTVPRNRSLQVDATTRERRPCTRPNRARQFWFRSRSVVPCPVSLSFAIPRKQMVLTSGRRRAQLDVLSCLEVQTMNLDLCRRMLAVAIEQARFGLAEGRHSDWRSHVHARRRAAQPGPQPPRAAGRPQCARRDRRLSPRRPAAKLSRPGHGHHACAVLVLQRAGAPVSHRHAGCRREPHVCWRTRLAAGERRGGD